MGRIIKEIQYGKDEYTRWIHPYTNKYRIICCDCGLSHDFEFRIVDNEVEFRARRNMRSTAQVRRHMKSILVNLRKVKINWGGQDARKEK